VAAGCPQDKVMTTVTRHRMPYVITKLLDGEFFLALCFVDRLHGWSAHDYEMDGLKAESRDGRPMSEMRVQSNEST